MTTPYEQTINHIKEEPTSVYGLKFFPSLGDSYNDIDSCLFGWPSGPEVSNNNLELMKLLLKEMGNNCKVIVEIGVHRNDEDSITHILMNNKPNNCIYLGIDLDDKSFLNNQLKRIYTIKSNSHDQLTIRNKLLSIGATHIDLLFIDGWHSVNTCINDWSYVDLLSNNGIIAMHDSNAHPGPIALFHSIDEKLFDKVRYCTGPDDMGIAVARHKK